MFLVVLGILIVASVPLAGGRLSKLADMQLRAVPLIFASLAIQVLVVTVFPGGDPGLHRVLHLVSYVLAAAFLVANRRQRGLVLVGLGALSNAVAIFANNGVMPATRAALRWAGEPVTTKAFTNSGLLAHPRLAFLGDVFAIPQPLPLHNVFSIGDVCIAVGATIVVHTVCETRLARWRSYWTLEISGSTPRASNDQPASSP